METCCCGVYFFVYGRGRGNTGRLGSVGISTKISFITREAVVASSLRLEGFSLDLDSRKDVLELVL
jgi:hypothetical protein